MQPRKRTKLEKTKAQIQKENRAKVWKKLREEVADREELWLDLFTQYSINLVAKDDTKDVMWCLDLASQMANRGLELYEARWGEK